MVGIHPISAEFERVILGRASTGFMNIFKQEILLVEDNDEDVFFINRALKEAGFEHAAHRVVNGEKAMAYLAGEGIYGDRAQYPIPGIVLLDLQLPGKHGFDVLRWINCHPSLRKLVVIVLTISAHSKDVGLAYKMGARSYLVKPVAPQQLWDLAQLLKGVWFK